MDHNAPANKRLGSPECGICQQDVVHLNATSPRIVMARFSNAIWLYGEINAGVSDVNDLQVTDRTSRVETTRADLPVGDAFGAIGQFLRDKISEWHAAQLP